MSSRLFNLLIVDDDPLIHQSIKLGLGSAWKIFSLHSDSFIDTNRFYHAAFVDMHLDPQSSEPKGLKVIEKLLKGNGQLEVVAMSGDLSRPLMEACLKAGAQRFLPKPLEMQELRFVVDKLEAFFELKNNASIGFTTTPVWKGRSAASENLRKQMAQLKGETSPILIEGDTGCGKEVVARLLHFQEVQRPFITVNVGSIPDHLFESEMFGHIKGAFTGADQNKIGLIEAAHGGDLFLDEIEAMPLAHQAKLLRFLESGEMRKVGAKDSIYVKTRVLAATNKSLEDMIRLNEFREDLFYRLNSHRIKIPPLHQRLEDILDLAPYFITIDRPKRNKAFSEDGLQELCKYHWPGNVRELKRVCEQLSLTSPLPLIRAEDVKRHLPTDKSSSLTVSNAIDFSLGLSKLIEKHEAQLIQKALSLTSGDIDSAAAILQISKSNLYKKIKEYNVEYMGQ